MDAAEVLAKAKVGYRSDGDGVYRVVDGEDAARRLLALTPDGDPVVLLADRQLAAYPKLTEEDERKIESLRWCAEQARSRHEAVVAIPVAEAEALADLIDRLSSPVPLRPVATCTTRRFVTPRSPTLPPKWSTRTTTRSARRTRRDRAAVRLCRTRRSGEHPGRGVHPQPCCGAVSGVRPSPPRPHLRGRPEGLEVEPQPVCDLPIAVVGRTR